MAYIIATRARYTEGFNADELELGEAKLGDFNDCGMTQREYRTAKQQLSKWGFATFKATSRGTIGKLMDTRLFDPTNVSSDSRSDEQLPNGRRAIVRQPTTNNKENKENNGEGEAPSLSFQSQGGSLTPKLTQSQMISKERELERATRELHSYGNPHDHDADSYARKRIKLLRPAIEKLARELGAIA